MTLQDLNFSQYNCVRLQQQYVNIGSDKYNILR